MSKRTKEIFVRYFSFPSRTTTPYSLPSLRCFLFLFLEQSRLNRTNKHLHTTTPIINGRWTYSKQRRWWYVFRMRYMKDLVTRVPYVSCILVSIFCLFTYIFTYILFTYIFFFFFFLFLRLKQQTRANDLFWTLHKNVVYVESALTMKLTLNHEESYSYFVDSSYRIKENIFIALRFIHFSI